MLYYALLLIEEFCFYRSGHTFQPGHYLLALHDESQCNFFFVFAPMVVLMLALLYKATAKARACFMVQKGTDCMSESS